MQMLSQKKMTQQAMQEARDASKQPGARPLDLLMNIIPGLAGIPGGMQMLGDVAPALLSAAQTEQYMGGTPGASPGASPGGASQPKQTLSPSERIDQRIRKNIERGQDLNVAQTNAQIEEGLISSEQQRQEKTQQLGKQFLDKQIAETYIEGLNPPIKDYISNEYTKDLLAGKTPQQAWLSLQPIASSMQKQDDNLNQLASRANFMMATDKNSKREVRNSIPTLIKANPDYAQSKVSEVLGYGNAEAAEIVRNPEKFLKFSDNIGIFREDFPKHKIGMSESEILEKRKDYLTGKTNDNNTAVRR